MTKTFTDGTTTTKVLVAIELAYGLLCAPADRMWHTFRPNIHAGDIVFRHPNKAGCKDPACPLLSAHEFLQKHRCPKGGCLITPEAILQRDEQKLVDTMLATDLLTCYYQSNREVAVVTSDDDIWPAIRFALTLGVQVFHIHTIPGRQTPSMYCRKAGTNYVQLQL